MSKMCKLLLAVLLVAVMVLAAGCDLDETVKLPVNVTTGAHTDPEKPEATTAPEVTVEETVLLEAEGVKVTVKGLSDSLFGKELKLLVENNSDADILLTADSVTANGYMMSGATLYAEVAAGKKANEELTLMSSSLEQSGIETLSELQFYLELQNPDNWDTIMTSDLLTVTTSAKDYVQPANDEGDLVYDDKGFKVVCKGLKQDVIWDGTVVFYMENNSDKEVSIHAENVSVNGFMQDVGMWSTLRANTKIVDGMTILDLSDLEIDSIDQIQTIEFNLRVVDQDSWDELVTTDVITLNFA